MLSITIPPGDIFDENTSKFISVKGGTIQLEHSLVSISKWESKWHKVFLDKDTNKTDEELMDYIRCMTLTQNVDPNLYRIINGKQLNTIKEYLENPMTATKFNEENIRKINGGGTARSTEKITSEYLYYQMVALQIPFECQKWHINRLITLIRICAIKNQPPKKMSRSDVLNRYRNTNAARRAAHGK